MGLVRKQFYLTSAQDRVVKRLAREQKTSESAILRKALEQFLVREGIIEMQDPFAELIDIFEGPSQVNHDDVYDQDRGRDSPEGR